MRFLDQRAVDAVEEMDLPGCDPLRLERTYSQFALVNAVVAGWRRVYLRHLRPRFAAAGPTTLLDIGCGGGDIDRRLARWAAKDGLELAITAVDPDERAHSYATRQPQVPGLEFRRAFSSDLVAEGRSFDLVISNHVLHHLTGPALQSLLQDTATLARRAAVHSDLERNPLAYALFAAGTLPFFHRSFIRADGLTSIRRSYTAAELRAAAPPGWLVEKQRPFRTLLVLDREAAGRA